MEKPSVNADSFILLFYSLDDAVIFWADVRQRLGQIFIFYTVKSLLVVPPPARLNA